MKNNIKALQLIESGLSSKTVSKLTESQIEQLHNKMVSEQGTSSAVSGKGFTTLSSKNPNAAEIAKNLNNKGVNVSMTEDEKEEMEEGKTKKGEPNPWAICHSQVGPKKTRKFERCVKAVKKSLKEGKNPVSLFLENEIMRIVEKHIPPKISKGDLLQYLSEDTTTAPSKPKTKPETKPGKTEPKPRPKSPGHNPNPGENPAPKATAPAKPKTKPETKPGKTEPKPRPKSPGHNPNPGENPAPKAISPEKAKNEVINAIMKILDNE